MEEETALRYQWRFWTRRNSRPSAWRDVDENAGERVPESTPRISAVEFRVRLGQPKCRASLYVADPGTSQTYVCDRDLGHTEALHYAEPVPGAGISWSATPPNSPEED